MSPPDVLQAALAYAAKGWPVLPLHSIVTGACTCGKKDCTSPGKHPRTRHGLKDATTLCNHLREAWKQWPDANVGIVTGEHLAVLDVDPRHGGDDSLAKLLGEHGTLPPTVEVVTGGGGRHLFFACTTPIKSRAHFRPGLDFKGVGGYVAASPSIHASGRRYQWAPGRSPDDIPLADLPAWLLLLLVKPARPTPAPTPPDAAMARMVDRATRYVAAVDGVSEGGRDNAAFSLAGHLLAYRTDDGEPLAQDCMIDLLRSWNARNTPPLPDRELLAKLDSAARNGSPRASKVVTAGPRMAEGVDLSLFNMGGDDDGEHAAPHSPADPGPLPDDLLRVPGFINEVMNFTLETAPYPNVALAFAGALALLATLTGRKIRDAGNNRSNLYLLGLAHSGAGKDRPRKVNVEILHAAEAAECIGGKFASGEAVQDALHTNPVMLFQTDEIDGLFQAITKSRDARHEGIMGELLTVYSSADSLFTLRRRAGEEAARTIDQPCLVVLGTATPVNYYQALSGRMLTNGFFARMIVVEAGRRSAGQEPRILPLPKRVLETAKWWAEYQPGKGMLAKEHPQPTIIKATIEAQAILAETREEVDAEYSKAEAADDPVATTIWARVNEHVRKLALLHAASENHKRPEISPAGTMWARHVMMHLARRMLFMANAHVADGEFDATFKRAVELLRKWEVNHGVGATMPTWELRRRLALHPRDFVAVCQELIGRHVAAVESEPSSTKPREGYRLL